MTNEEALTSAKQRLFNMQMARGFYKSPPNMLTETIDFLKTTIEALEKQISKKPNIIVVHDRYQRPYIDKYLCPVCGESVDTDCGDPFIDYGLDWCNHCGQKIDWSEEK